MEYVIFGASKFGEAALRDLSSKFDIKYFCDNSAEKQGRLFCGLNVIAPDELFGKRVIVASYYNLEIAQQLIEMGILDFYAAYDGGNGAIEAGFIELSKYKSLEKDKRRVCLVCENNSGSNTLALAKLAVSDKYDFAVVREKKKDSDYYYNIFTSGVVMRTHGGSAVKGAVNIQLWHGIGLKPLAHMTKQPYAQSLAKEKMWQGYDAVFSYSQMYNLILHACFGSHEAKYYITGAPRNDFLYKSDGRGLLSEITEIDADKRLILYAPTYREDVYGYRAGLKSAYLYNMEGLSIKDFDAFLCENNAHMIMKLHPFDVDEAAKKVTGLKNITLLTDEELSDKDLDFYEVLNAFDILISDYSSIASDFMLLDRPIIYLTPDREQIEQDEGFLFEPFELWCPGEVVNSVSELKRAVENVFITDNYVSQRKLVRDIFHKHQDGESTARVLEALEEASF